MNESASQERKKWEKAEKHFETNTHGRKNPVRQYNDSNLTLLLLLEPLPYTRTQLLTSYDIYSRRRNTTRYKIIHPNVTLKDGWMDNILFTRVINGTGNIPYTYTPSFLL